MTADDGLMNRSNRNLDLLASWHYDLPPELIACRPAAQRDQSRLMVVLRETGEIQHRSIRDLPELLQRNDLLVLNNTQVLPARLFGYRTKTGGKWEGLFVRETAPAEWTILCETRGRLQPGETVTIIPADAMASLSPPQANNMSRDGAELAAPDLQGVEPLIATLLHRHPDGSWQVKVESPDAAPDILGRYGCLPLPPYMGRRLADADDRQRYQTTYAREPGAVAAPTAGLHFTAELLAACQQAGIASTEVTLHVGIGTFRPVTVTDLNQHDMHYEWCRVTPAAAERIQHARAQGGRVIAVGTTSVRTLESLALQQLSPSVSGWQGETNLFIRPGFRFELVNGLLTNFHLPGSTLIVLVAAFMGYDLAMEAYRQAVEQRYRFYSYGDAMLIL